MDNKGRNLGTFDTMHTNAKVRAHLARNAKNDVESELTTNHFNRIFHVITTKIKKVFKKNRRRI